MKVVKRKTAPKFVSLSSAQPSSLTASSKNLKMHAPLAPLRDSPEPSKSRPETWHFKSSLQWLSGSSSTPVCSNECKTKTRMVVFKIVQTPAIKSTNRSKMRFSTKFKLNCKICERLITQLGHEPLKQAQIWHWLRLATLIFDCDSEWPLVKPPPHNGYFHKK